MTFVCESSFVHAEEVFDVAIRQPDNRAPSFMNLHFKAKRPLPDRFDPRGTGIYSIFFDNRLVYIGIFRGSRGVPGRGNILGTRWARHLQTLTLRGSKASFSATPLKQLISEYPNHEVTRALSAADSTRLKFDNGHVSGANRARLALEFWHLLGSGNDVLEHFSFLYTRVVNPPVGKDVSFIKKRESAETYLIQKIRPRCNEGIVPDPNSFSLSSKDIVSEVESAVLKYVNSGT